MFVPATVAITVGGPRRAFSVLCNNNGSSSSSRGNMYTSARIVRDWTTPRTLGTANIHRTLSTSSSSSSQRPFIGNNHNYDRRVFFFDIDNCMYSKHTGIPQMMKERIEQYFRDSGIPHDEVETLAYRYYVDYGLAIRGLVEKHPGIDISDYDDKVDGDLPLETILQKNQPLRDMIQSMSVGKKWLFTNAGEKHANRVINILGLQGLFDGLTYCNYLEPNFVCKPDRKAFEKAMRQAGVQDPALCYFVDDSAPNIDMAVKMGWTAVHLDEDATVTSTSGKHQIQSILHLPNTLPQFWRQE